MGTIGDELSSISPVGFAGFFHSIRARLVVLLIAATLPLFALAIYGSWQAYTAAVAGIRRDARVAADAAISRPAAAFLQVATAARVLAATGRLADASGPDCSAGLLALVKALAPLLDNAVLGRRDGGPPCAAVPSAPNLPSPPPPGPPTLLATADAGSGARPFAWAAFPLSDAGTMLLAQMALRPSMFSAADALPIGTAAWLAQGASIIQSITPAASAPLPPALTEGTLAHPGTVQTGAWQGGARYAFIARPLLAQSAILVGVPVERRLAGAQDAFVRRVTELGLLLVAGIVALVVGADAWVVEPVKRLSRAVGRWRAGGPFDHGLASGAPAEAAELAQVFGQSSLALRKYESDLHGAKLRQDLLIQEIHHRVKNNLQVVASLLNLQASRIRVPAAKAEFQAARDRIRALATLHRHLYAHAELQAVDMKGFLEDLCAQLLQAVGETPAGGRIQLNITAVELRISADQAVPVSLIVTEAVSNAAKYAFPDGRSGQIWVRLGRDAGEVQLTIEDDGIGIPAGRAETDSGIRDGIGIQLIRGFAKQLGGQLDVHQGEGTSYRVAFPLREARPEHEVA